jgi:hypothetical protein
MIPPIDSGTIGRAVVAFILLPLLVPAGPGAVRQPILASPQVTASKLLRGLYEKLHAAVKRPAGLTRDRRSKPGRSSLKSQEFECC